MIIRCAYCLIVTVLCVVGAYAQSRLKPSTQSSPRQVLRTEEDIFDDQAHGRTPQDVKIIMSAQGGGIVINNVFKTAKRSADDRYLGYVISDEIEYSAGGGHSGFIITAHGNDSALLMAESRFTKLLGITSADACRLAVLEYAIPEGGESHYVRGSFSNCSPNEQHKNRISGQTSTVNLIGYVRKEHIADGCGCTYRLKGDTTNSVYSDDFGGNTWMNIDGQDEKLKLVNSVSIPRGKVRMGQRTTNRYTAFGIEVRINIVVGKDYGEGHDYSGTITVVKGSRSQTVQIVGSCGC